MRSLPLPSHLLRFIVSPVIALLRIAAVCLLRFPGRALTLLALGLAIPSAGAGASGVIEAPEALREAEAGRLILIDIRTPAEWQATGIARGARAINLLGPDGDSGFVTAVRGMLQDNPEAPVALICRSGNRSAKARRLLEAAGFRNVFDVAEGMGGGRGGPGWLQRGLPVDRPGGSSSKE